MDGLKDSPNIQYTIHMTDKKVEQKIEQIRNRISPVMLKVIFQNQHQTKFGHMTVYRMLLYKNWLNKSPANLRNRRKYTRFDCKNPNEMG